MSDRTRLALLVAAVVAALVLAAVGGAAFGRFLDSTWLPT